MSTDVDRPVQIVSPTTGELLGLDSPTEDLAGYLADVRELEAELREAKRVVSEAILARLDEACVWTAHLPGVKVSAPSPAPALEYDELALREALLRLADDGLIAVEAVDRAIEPVVTYKVKAAGVKALEKRGGQIAETINAHRRLVEKRRTVSVSRA